MSVQAFGIPTGTRRPTTRQGQLARSASLHPQGWAEVRQLTLDAFPGVALNPSPTPVYRTASRTRIGLLELAGVHVYPFRKGSEVIEHARERSAVVVDGWDE